ILYFRIRLSRHCFSFFSAQPCPPLFPYTTLFRSRAGPPGAAPLGPTPGPTPGWTLLGPSLRPEQDRKARRTKRLSRFGKFVLRRSEEHTSELQSRFDLVCRLLLEKKNVF